jgi:hypothetical protein
MKRGPGQSRKELDQRQFHEDAIDELRREHRRAQGRIDAMYEDKGGELTAKYRQPFDILAVAVAAK